MILNITNYCTMNCKHCFNNSNENGTHMYLKIFKDAIEKIKLWNPILLLISGGEPTSHPDFIYIIEYIKYKLKNTEIIVTSNGLFTLENIKVNEYKKLNVTFQIVHDKKYYKKDIRKIDYNNFIYCDTIPESNYLINLGRAKKMNIKFNNVPKCINFRSFIIAGNTISDAIILRELDNKYCNPVIYPNGDITIGETNSCYVVGSIYDNDKVIENNIKNFTSDKCNKCNGFDNLSIEDKNRLKYMYSQYGAKL